MALVAAGAVVVVLLGVGTTGAVAGWWGAKIPVTPPPSTPPSTPPTTPPTTRSTTPTTTPTTTPPTTSPTTPPTTPPGPDPEVLLATQFGLGPATVGTSVADVEAALGLDLVEQWSDRECIVRLDDAVGIGTVDNAGAVQTYVVLNPAVRTVEGIGVGSTYDEIAATYPEWIAGVSGWTTDDGGRFVTVQPSAFGQSPDTSGSGRHMMFELDADDVVQRYRVGAPPYVFHVDLCTTPD